MNKQINIPSSLIKISKENFRNMIKIVGSNIKKVFSAQSLLTILFNIGLYCTSKFIIGLLKEICNNNITEIDLIEKYGNGRVILAGSSTGIGLSIAKVLSKKGFKILLMDKGEQQLNETILNIKKDNENADIIPLPFNFDKVYNEDELRLLQFKLIDYINDTSIFIVNFDLNNINNEKPNESIYDTNPYIRGYAFLNKIIINKMNERDSCSLIVNCLKKPTNCNTIPNIYKNAFFNYQKSFIFNIPKINQYINTSLILIDDKDEQNNESDEQDINLVEKVVNKFGGNSIVYLNIRQSIYRYLHSYIPFYIKRK